MILLDVLALFGLNYLIRIFISSCKEQKTKQGAFDGCDFVGQSVPAPPYHLPYMHTIIPYVKHLSFGTHISNVSLCPDDVSLCAVFSQHGSHIILAYIIFIHTLKMSHSPQKRPDCHSDLYKNLILNPFSTHFTTHFTGHRSCKSQTGSQMRCYLSQSAPNQNLILPHYDPTVIATIEVINLCPFDICKRLFVNFCTLESVL